MKTCIPSEIAATLKKSIQNGEISEQAIINMLPEERASIKSLLEDYVSDKLGISVSQEQVKEINIRAKKIEEAQLALGSDISNPLKRKENLEFFKAKKSMDDYLQSQNPANRLKVATGTIGRGMMLTSIKSPILNIGSNIEIGLTEAIARRISNGAFQGADNKLAKEFVSMAREIYQKTGYDISRMTNIYDIGADGGRVLGDVGHSQGPGTIRKVGRAVEDVVFKQLMGAPDVEFASRHFADSVNLNAFKMANGDTTSARNIMEDAMRLEPQTAEGLILREQAIMDAETATWTNTTWASRVSSGIRKILNDVSGDVRAGDYFLPFVKTPANVIATGMDYAGMGVPKALVKVVKGIKSGEIGSKESIQSISRDLIRSGIGLTGAFVIASQLKDSDFVGAYDPNRSQIEALRNSNYNAIRIGNKWISTDWFGPLAVPITSMMYARKYGNTKPEKIFQYGKGTVSAVMNLPGISDIYDYVRSNALKSNQSLEEMTGATQDYITSQLYSRMVPSIVSDISKVIDDTARQGGKGIEGIKARFPFVSKTLPAKTTIFGEEIKNEGPISTLAFGSRVKTNRESPVVTELSRLSTSTGKGISFTDFLNSSSKTLKQFKDKVGPEKYAEANKAYREELKKQVIKAINDPRYQKLSDEERLKAIAGKDTDAMNIILKRYGFKYKPEKTKKIPNI